MINYKTLTLILLSIEKNRSKWLNSYDTIDIIVTMLICKSMPYKGMYASTLENYMSEYRYKNSIKACKNRGYLYEEGKVIRMTDKGRKVSERIISDVKRFIDEFNISVSEYE